MNKNLNRILPLSLLMALLSISSIYSSDNKWDIKIELSKQDYVLHEPIWLDVTLTNNTSDTVRTHGLNPPNHLLLYIVLTDSDGKEIEYTGPLFSLLLGPNDRGELLLDGGEQDYDSFNLLELFMSLEWNSGYKVSYRRFPYIPKGTYTVKAYYEGDLSNELTFRIVEPYGEEEEVLRKIEKAWKVWSRADTDASSQIYGEVARDYPNSVFAEKCYYLHRVYANNMEGSISLVKGGQIIHTEMLSRYPNSGNVRAWSISITYWMSEDEQIAYYNESIEKHPNTKFSKVAGLLKKRLLAEREAGE